MRRIKIFLKPRQNSHLVSRKPYSRVIGSSRKALDREVSGNGVRHIARYGGSALGKVNFVKAFGGVDAD